MIFQKVKCDSGCHGQGILIVGPFQFEYGYALPALRFGAELNVSREKGAAGLVVFFGPFQLSAALRWWSPVQS